jgi:hypothetical protein
MRYGWVHGKSGNLAMDIDEPIQMLVLGFAYSYRN